MRVQRLQIVHHSPSKVKGSEEENREGFRNEVHHRVNMEEEEVITSTKCNPQRTTLALKEERHEALSEKKEVALY